ncbi:glycosyltransferase family 4 protein [Cellulosimicrobium marinum]|uniref:glycosyltransferase family 4 protein n=1 Tax=Cellulosimicrobium marinum TaxID=1638992 RepID=UPI001E2B61E8|nr:glycosyltransferase family 1 protein [Cellulosimicrobium marinum]MCB7137052.1 glycosyltransferase family 4 protein [Cellulosimicrobium marinum]
MARLTLATIAVGVPMGQQVYEREVSARAERALGPGVTVHRSVTRSLRSPLPGTVRLPHWVLREAPAPVRRAVGAVMYPRADVVHRMGLSLPPARVPEIVTVHDTVAWRFPDESAPEPFAAQETRRARAVISVSRFAADDVAERLGLDHVHVVHNGVDDRFFAAVPLAAEQLRGLGVDGPYVLHAGGSSLRKNLDGLAAAWPRVRSAHPDVRLVLSGPPSQRRDRLFGPLDGALRVGLVPDELLPGLVAGARAVVVPSLYEGFGLPALEAMAAGVPVVAADRSSLPEVCGDAGILVEPDGAGLADGLVHALSGTTDVTERVARGRARSQRFTWDACAAAHAAVWREVLAGT